jgi:hypothetical protein
VEQAVCALLLGEGEHALRVLRIQQDAPQPPDKEVAAFVAKHDTSSHYGTLLAACALGEQWVHSVVVPSVTWGPQGEVGEADARPFDFESWGATPQVRLRRTIYVACVSVRSLSHGRGFPSSLPSLLQALSIGAFRCLHRLLRPYDIHINILLLLSRYMPPLAGAKVPARGGREGDRLSAPCWPLARSGPAGVLPQGFAARPCALLRHHFVRALARR